MIITIIMIPKHVMRRVVMEDMIMDIVMVMIIRKNITMSTNMNTNMNTSMTIISMKKTMMYQHGKNKPWMLIRIQPHSVDLGMWKVQWMLPNK
jgi:hypothetical protein